ncbi:hypothetical protein C7N43_21670, partial [Sphingobacteriales bacterium UPWRP_1]
MRNYLNSTFATSKSRNTNGILFMNVQSTFCSMFLMLLWLMLYTVPAKAQCTAVVPPATVNGVNVTGSGTGSIQTFLTAFTSCGSVTTPANSIWLGPSGAFSYTFTFSQPVNNVVVAITGTGGNINETFTITTSAGTPSLTAISSCFSSIASNVITSGAGAGANGGGGYFRVSNTGFYTTLTIAGPGGDNGSQVALCGDSFAPSGCSATTLFVDASVPASGSGTTWGTAFKTFDEALFTAHTCPNVTTINVAAGLYKPTKKPYNAGLEITTADAREVTFHIRDGLAVYGGFPAGGGTRNVAANATILSGDIDNNDSNVDGNNIAETTANIAGSNAYHVVLASAAASGGVGVTIDGFIITAGNPNGTLNLSVNGNNIGRNNGGGIFIINGTNTLTNNTLSGNLASNQGGGMYVQNGTNAITASTLSGNTAFTGGGIYAQSGVNNTIVNNALSGNSASGGNGGGIFMTLGTTTLTNNTLSGNAATGNGGGLSTSSGTNTISNNIFWGNQKAGNAAVQGADYNAAGANGNTFTNCLLQLTSVNYPVSTATPYGIGAAATGNIFAQDPFFANAADIYGADNLHRTADDGLRLSSCSPAINSGTSTNAPSTDIIGTSRPQFTGIDIGAYESTTNFSAPTANISGATTGCGSVTLTASGGTSYAWSGGNSPTSATNTFTTSGSYTVTVTETNGCSATASASVTVNTVSTANAGPDQTVTVNSATMAANTPAFGVGQWSLVSGSGTITNTGSPTTSITNLGVGTNIFQWTISNAPCTPSTNEVEITYAPPVSLTCPQNIAVAACQTQAAVNLAFDNWLATASASGGCNGSLSNNNTGAPSACGGSTTVTFTYTSTCTPFTTTCQATFTVTATASPTPVFSNCTNNTVSLGCNPLNLPSCTAIASGGFGGNVTASNSCGSVPVTCSAGSIVENGCNRTQVFTFEATACGQTVTCTRTFTWTVVTPPSFNGTCGNGVINLGCNPVNLPSCDPNVTASNQCGPITVNCNVGAITVNGCNRSQTLTYAANASGCGTFSTCTRIFNWQVTTAPVFANCDNTIDLGCNPATLPTCVNAQTTPFGGAITASNECGNVSDITCSAGTVTNNGCNRSQVFTFTITGCGFTTTCTRTFTWSVDPTATLTCPGNTTTAAGQTQVAIDTEFSNWLASANFSGGCNAILTNNNTGAPAACGGSTTVTFTLDLICQTDKTCTATFTVASLTAPTGALTITNSTCSNCTLGSGSIALGTVTGTGGTLEFSTNGGTNWSASLPTYNQSGPAQTIIASVLGANGCRSATTNVGTTSPGTCTPVTAGITNNTGTTVLTCSTTNISLTATGGDTYAWSGGLGSLANATVTTANTYTVTVTSTNGCTATANITITQDPTPCCPNLTAAAPPAVVSSQSACAGCALSGGVIAAPATACPVGSTLQYSTDNGVSWSTTL